MGWKLLPARLELVVRNAIERLRSKLVPGPAGIQASPMLDGPLQRAMGASATSFAQGGGPQGDARCAPPLQPSASHLLERVLCAAARRANGAGNVLAVGPGGGRVDRHHVHAERLGACTERRKQGPGGRRRRALRRCGGVDTQSLPALLPRPLHFKPSAAHMQPGSCCSGWWA